MPRTGTEQFPKTGRLLKRAEFVQLSRRGFRVQSANFIIISSANQRPQSRLGITVSAKVGNSVVRNRIKRQVRECFRRRRSALQPGADILVIARAGAAAIAGRNIEGELGRLFGNLAARRNL